MSLQQDVRAIADRYLRKVSPSGPDNIMAICPFHTKSDGQEEKNPSFAMSLTKGVFYCHACHEKGSLYNFLTHMGLSGQVIKNQYQALIDDLATTSTYTPFDPIRPVLTKQEPMEEGVLGLFQYCPLALINEGYPEALLKELEIGYDPLHERITFPLRTHDGKLIGISGRTTLPYGIRYKVYDKEYEDYGLPKRENTPKNSLLWNYHRVYPITSLDPNPHPVVVVEGFKACISVLASGITTSVALLGSYMSPKQQYLLERLGAPIYLMLDNDNAGQAGTNYIAPLLAKSVQTKIVQYEAPQPSDLTEKQIRKAISQAKNYYIWSLGE